MKHSMENMIDSNGQTKPAHAAEPTAYGPPDIAAVLEAHRDEKHIVVLQNYPDPDAIACAFAHELLANYFDIDVDIVYRGRISHRQNAALVKLLGIELIRYEPDLDLSQYDAAVLVDNQGTTSKEIIQALHNAGVPILIIVDHHEAQERPEAVYVDIRRTGAAATIYAEYLRDGPIDLDSSSQDHMLAATALMHGIMTDTGTFIRAKSADFQAAAFLSNYRNADMIEQIMNQARTKQTMEVIRQALGNRITIENFSISGIGYVRAADRDAIPQAADFLLTEENVHTSIVYGILLSDSGDESLIGSMRTIKLTLDLDEFIKDVFGKDAAGRYFGGGKMAAGAFEIPIGFLSGSPSKEFQEMKWQTYDAQIKQKIYTQIGIESPPSSS